MLKQLSAGDQEAVNKLAPELGDDYSRKLCVSTLRLCGDHYAASCDELPP